MKLSLDRPITGICVLFALAIPATFAAHADLPRWMQSVVSNSTIEAALYRTMDLPGIRTLYPRPPAEAQRELTALVSAKPDTAPLYALRAHVEEQALDFTAAEKDWKSFAIHSRDSATAQFQLADFYHRRNQAPQEIAALEQAAALPSSASEKFLAADQQQAWKAFPRALAVAHDQGLENDATIAIDKAWITRYPQEPSSRANLIATFLQQHRFEEAQHAIADYQASFPQDQLLPIKASALLALDENTPDATARALALFDKQYQPLWPTDLIQTYFQLLTATHTAHAMLANAQAQLVQHPDDVNAATRIVFYYQQQGRTQSAADAIARYAASKETRHAPWTPDELYTFAILLDRSAQYISAARYYFALASTPGHLTAAQQTSEEAGLTGIIHILLTAPDQAIDLGSGNLSIYSDLATIDQGPGYLNGILSLWLNSQNPASELSSEEQKAVPYFHRAKAAELLAVLDQRYSASSSRPALRAQLIEAFKTYGDDAAVKQAAQQFLTDFPHASERMQVALDLAEVDERTGDTQAEFALYASLLTELSAPLQGMPLTATGNPPTTPVTPAPVPALDESSQAQPAAAPPSTAILLQQALTLTPARPPTAATADAYQQILNRYLSRLTSTNQLPAALAVLKKELDRNPNDPLLYERLADFLQQNNLAAQQEQVYQQALVRFNDTTFYDKLARLYLRERRREEFSTLTRKVVDTFEGTDLEQYFNNVNHTWPEAYLQLNLYAHQRFPHELAFTRNLLSAYETEGTADPTAHERLLREHWQESPDLQAQFFDLLSRTQKLPAELAALEALAPTPAQQTQNPAAAQELAEIHLWQSHFEQSAPLLGRLADQYPADQSLGTEAASVFRSLAYFDPTQIAHSVAITRHLAAADPTNLDHLATIGDTYADSTATSLNLDASNQLAQATPFWLAMSNIHPGLPDGYLESATVFWDYFQFDEALTQIAAARKHFGNPALYAYQAGAIDENKRDYPSAIAEYVTASSSATPGTESEAHARLLTLATRPQFKTLIDQATANAASAHPTLATLELRIDILEALQQKTAIAPLVDAAISKASTLDALQQLATFSQTHRLPAQYRSTLQREITLATDPIQHIELQYQLANAFRDADDLPGALRLIDSVHQANSKLVGVVRTTTDFYWNNKQPRQAIDTLVQASHEANPALAHDYTLEAIAKSNQSADYAGARTILKPLLTADPFNPQYLNLQAQSFSLAHDDTALRDLYLTTIAALKTAPLSTPDRRDKIALARQGMIPALTSLKDYDAAIDQHIALISAFPEDATILQSAASYARLHSREPRLIAFLNKTAADSPKDSRFLIDLARVDVQFEDYPGALAAYSKAIAIRADRPDLYIARADLEEHQQAFDPACADYDRLYLLTYHDPQWMEKSALARARQGKPDLVVKALQTAWIEGRPASAANNFRVATQLEAWDLIPQALPFAEQGVKLAGDDLLTTSQNNAGAVLYVRLLGRQRKAADAFALLTRLLPSKADSPSSPAIIAQQVEDKGIASVTDADWRKRLVTLRQQQAQTTYRDAVQELSTVVATFYTPEEKFAFATLLDAQRANRPAPEVADTWIPAAHTAGLLDREAAWRRDVLLSAPRLAPAQLNPFDTLEAFRMDNVFRAQTLDAYAVLAKPKAQPNVLTMAAHAWHDAGDTPHEIADLRKLALVHQQQESAQRLFELYLAGNPTALLQLTTGKSKLADQAANFILANAPQPLAYKAVQNRSLTRTAVWNTANSALLGLYFADTSPAIDTAFQSTLADQTIDQRLQSRPDKTRQLIGDPWFYYASRYGVWLTLSPKPPHDPEDFLPSDIEHAPNDAASYLALARIYVDAHQVDAALAEYRHAIEIDPEDPTPNIAMADILWSANRHDEALAEWNQALAKLRAMVDNHAVPESFWTQFALLATQARDHQVSAKLKPGMTIVLEAYLRKNGGYRSSELLDSAWLAFSKDDQAAATEWLISLIQSMPPEAQSSALSELSNTSWFPKPQLERVYRLRISLLQAQMAASLTGENSYFPSQIASLQATYLEWLIAANRLSDAQRLYDSIPAAQRTSEIFQPGSILLAARQSRLPAFLASFQSDPSSAPTLDQLAHAANRLHLAKDDADSRLLLEYVFQQKLQQQLLTAPDYLALAEARIHTADLPGALDLLNRLTRQGGLGAYYDNLDAAASLLVRTGHNAEALPLLSRLANGTPWKPIYRLRLGQAQLALKQSPEAAATLSAVADTGDAPYTLRAQAAEVLHATPSPKTFDSAELNLLTSGKATPQQADQPYFVQARILAAAKTSPAQRPAILREALKTAPEPMRDRLRLQIFQAEFAQSHNDQAETAIQPILPAIRALLSPASDPASSDDAQQAYESSSPTAEETGASGNAGQVGEATESADSNPYSLQSLLNTPPSRLSLALALATMHERTHAPLEAIQDLKAALALTDDEPRKSTLTARIASLQDVVALQSQNESRRPILQNSLTQTNLVRPRLTAAAAQVPQ